ncbi:MAG: Possible alpha-xyloside ABC transporter, permease component [uncultured Thermomicrobiales bacterium]|uniref:Possible alpha-xyloside ABC transporter, permease component n=1 Tax=uncultured Thermomicrobiales bacterium TaxID=1645740 RepID=A0A6J4UJE3_9BACT|nr:MAG: Possible alpha-xyloside ABC transporter, permease component [uncultured Thermomicrobiales bacterium]
MVATSRPNHRLAGRGTPRGGPTLRRRIWRHRWMYAFFLPGVVYFLVFVYLPLAGNIIAFKDYSPFLGFARSPWVGLENFERLFTDPDFRLALTNTLKIEGLQLLFAFPAPLGLALLLNSMVSDRAKRLVQSIVYLPHFLSWVIVISLWQQIFGGAGFINQVLRDQGMDTVNIMSNPDLFKPLVVLQVIWKEAGWGTILFLAALTKIDAQLYEAAVIDGAGGWRRLRDVTLPGIRSVIVLLLILRLAFALSVGFEQYYLQRNAVGAGAAEVLDTFIYFRGIQNGDWGFATAVGLVRGIVGALLILGANWLAKRFGEEGIL